MKSVTLADIANETGFSVNTVSHALNNKPDISAKTKKYIQEVANRMGYIVNSSAAALRSGRTRSIAIIVGDISNPHFSIIIKEIEGLLRKSGYNSIIINTDEDENEERQAITSAISKNVDGIIICPVQKSKKNIEYLVKTSVPYVLIGRRFMDISSNYVICDDLNGGYVAAEHLLKLGHKNILFINAPSHISSSRDRLEGVKRAIEAYNDPSIKLAVSTVSPTDNDKAVEEVISKNTSYSGIICFSDIIAMQACFFLKQQGRAVPKDASVIGFDNIASKFYLPLMITSVTSSKTKMSSKAVEVLLDILDNSNASLKQHILPTKVIERETTAFNN